MFSKKLALVATIALVAVIGAVCVFAPESTGLRISDVPRFKGPIDTVWAQWKIQYNKTYGSAEEKARFAIFKVNYGTIQNSNAQGKNYTLALNKFADLTNKEFTVLYTGSSTPNLPELFYCDHSSCGKLPSNHTPFDGRNSSGPVKDQGKCGSSWAFSTIDAIGKQDFALSAQELIDCSSDNETSYFNNGCNGGWVQNAFNYVIENGIASEADYPYTGVLGKCNRGTKKSAINIIGCMAVDFGNVGLVKSTMSAGYRVVAHVVAGISFQFYSSGILDDLECIGSGELNHAVLLVGYTNTTFFVKNSWGADWGEQGFVQISSAYTNENNGICGILKGPFTMPKFLNERTI